MEDENECAQSGFPGYSDFISESHQAQRVTGENSITHLDWSFLLSQPQSTSRIHLGAIDIVRGWGSLLSAYPNDGETNSPHNCSPNSLSSA